MAARQWVGAAPRNAKDIVTVGYIQSQIAALNLSQATVDSLVSQGFSNYVDLSYVNTQAALNATQAYIDGTGGANPNGGDAGRLKLAQVNQPNGVAGLGADSAKVDRSRLSLASTQRWPLPYASPAAYNTAAVTTGMTEETVYSWTVNDPGYTYKLLVDGIVDGATSRDGYYPIVLVRAGSATGPVIALGYGCGDSYSGAMVTQYVITTDQAGNVLYDFTYDIPVWAVTLDILALGGGGGGASGVGNPLIWGDGGFAAPWATATVTIGSTALPAGVTQITGTVGPGGGGGAGALFSNPGGGGAPTTVTYYQTTLTSPGGGGGSGVEGNQGGQDAGAATVGGYTYQNGGHGCGGMGGPGGAFISNPGYPGGSGLVIIVAHPLGGDWNAGPINIIPGSLSDQSPLTGSTDLYVQLLRVVGDNTTNGTVTASTFHPSMYATPVPA